MDNSTVESGPNQNRPSFFGRPASFALWLNLGQRYWGGLISGVGLGLFAAKFLQDLHLWTAPWVGFVAISLIGGGSGLALRAVRYAMLHDEKNTKTS